MFRAMTLVGLLLAAFATSAVAQKDKSKDEPKAKTFASPKECFEAVLTAMEKRDVNLLMSCMSPDAQKRIAVDLVEDGLRLRARAEGKDKDKKDEEFAKKYKPVFDVMDKHGLTEKALKDLVENSRLTKKGKEEVRKLIKDHAAFARDFMTAQEKAEPTPERKNDEPKPKLADLKIDGNKATANVVVTFSVKIKGKDKDKDTEETKESKHPVKFEKIDGGWRIDPDAKDDEEAPKPKDGAKDKKDK